MTEKKNKTAKYKIIESENGISYQFFCDISGALVSETMPIKSDNPEKKKYGKTLLTLIKICMGVSDKYCKKALLFPTQHIN